MRWANVKNVLLIGSIRVDATGGLCPVFDAVEASPRTPAAGDLQTGPK